MSDISVLLTIRNWDLTRVEMCLRSLRKQQDVDAELVVVDYGSDNPHDIERVVRPFDVRLKRVEAGEWSRSLAMNAAAAEATSNKFIFADADLVFDPRVLKSTVDFLDTHPRSILMFSFRDLPQGIIPEDLLGEIDFEELDRNSLWRPRWGMGVQAYSRESFETIRGFDNRMKIYGGEDNDIAKRARAHGYRLHWANEPEYGLYHVWHPSSRQIADSDPEQKAIVAANSEIAKNDPSILRNLDSFPSKDPLVSVVITTHNRAEYIEESIRSVLSQTVQDFEILVLDDDSIDNTKEVVESIGDARIRYFQFEKTGIPGLRNFALEESRGKYTAIHDDDDLMLPWSLEKRLQAIIAGSAGAYGGSINFNDRTGSLEQIPGRGYSLHSILNGGKVFLHATLLIETRVLKAIRYEEDFQSGSDFNLALRIAKAGVNLVHCGDFVLLRRLHDKQVTMNDSAVQHNASYCSSFAQRVSWGYGGAYRSKTVSEETGDFEYDAATVEIARVLPYLPDHLIDKRLVIVAPTAEELQGLDDAVTGRLVDKDGAVQIAVATKVTPSILTRSIEKSNFFITAELKSEERNRTESLLESIRAALGLRNMVVVNPDSLHEGFTILKEPNDDLDYRSGQTLILEGDDSLDRISNLLKVSDQ